MRRSVDEMLRELYLTDTRNEYEISFVCGRWKIRNRKTGEGIDTDAGFSKAKRWMLGDMQRNKQDKIRNGRW